MKKEELTTIADSIIDDLQKLKNGIYPLPKVMKESIDCIPKKSLDLFMRNIHDAPSCDDNQEIALDLIMMIDLIEYRIEKSVIVCDRDKLSEADQQSYDKVLDYLNRILREKNSLFPTSS